jgi:hypothetical protein
MAKKIVFVVALVAVLYRLESQKISSGGRSVILGFSFKELLRTRLKFSVSESRFRVITDSNATRPRDACDKYGALIQSMNRVMGLVAPGFDLPTLFFS